MMYAVDIVPTIWPRSDMSDMWAAFPPPRGGRGGMAVWYSYEEMDLGGHLDNGKEEYKLCLSYLGRRTDPIPILPHT